MACLPQRCIARHGCCDGLFMGVVMACASAQAKTLSQSPCAHGPPYRVAKQQERQEVVLQAVRATHA